MADTLALAFKSLLSKPQWDYSTAGSWEGPVKKLLPQLLWCGEFHDDPDRPHEAGELRKVIKARAVDLHRDHGVVITLIGATIRLSLLNRK